MFRLAERVRTFLSRFIEGSDDEHNDKQLGRVRLICDSPPLVRGRIRIVSGSGCGELRTGRGVVINSSVWANPVGGSETVLAFFRDDATIELGDGVGISNVNFVSSVSIRIGSNSMIGAGSRIYDTDFHSIYSERRIQGDVGKPCSPIVIGNGVLVGAFSTILKGVTIGDESVIGAGSVVTKDVPPRQLWAGVPARFIKTIDRCEDVAVEKYLIRQAGDVIGS